MFEQSYPDASKDHVVQDAGEKIRSVDRNAHVCKYRPESIPEFLLALEDVQLFPVPVIVGAVNAHDVGGNAFRVLEKLAVLGDGE